MSFIGGNKNTNTNKGVQVTGLWEQYKRDESGNKTDQVSHLSGKVPSDYQTGEKVSFTVESGDTLKIWPNGFKDQQNANAPSYILRLYKADGTVEEIPVESKE